MIHRLPIRVRVAVLATVAGLVGSLAIAGLTLWRTAASARADLDEYLSQEASEALALISTGGRFSDLVDIDSLSGPSQRLALYDAEGRLVDVTPTPPPVPDLTSTSSRLETLNDAASGESMRTIVLPISTGEQPSTLVVASSLEYVSDRVVRTTVLVVPFALLAALGVGVAGYAISRLVLRPVVALTESARELAASPGGRRLEVPTPHDEIRRLAETLNAGLEAIDAVMDVHTEFVAAASHELRAPLARIAADIEFAQRPTRTPEEVSERLARLECHTAEMVAIADDLLDRLAHRDLPPSGVTPAGDAIDVVLSQLDHLKSLRVGVAPVPPDALVVWDTAQVAGAVRNLVDNAYRHGIEPVGLTIDFSDDAVAFAVDDAGPGIPQDRWNLAVRPFQRIERAVPTAGTGIGLAVVSRVAGRHGGVLEFESGPPFRTVLRLPLFETSLTTSQ